MPLLALLPMLAPMLEPILRRLVGSIGGDKAEAEVASVVGTLFGGTDEARLRAAMANPQQVTDTAVRLTEVAAQREAAEAQARLEAERARLADVANARARDATLQSAGRRNVRADVMVTLVIVAIVAGMCFLYFGRILSGSAIEGAVLGLIGGMAKCFYDAFQFEFGKTRGSADKSATLDRVLGSASGSQGPPIATTGDVLVNGSPQGLAEPGGLARQPSPPGTTADDLNRQQLGEPPRVRVKAGSTAAVSLRFDACVPVTLAEEGGYANNPKDKGGPTNMGITIRTLASWREHGVTEADVRALSVEEAGQIFQARYWLRNRCDQMPAGVDLAVFDFTVNSAGWV